LFEIGPELQPDVARAVAGPDEGERLLRTIRQDGCVKVATPLCTLIETFTIRITFRRFVLLGCRGTSIGVC
jgi:hypothetical protein